MIKKALIYLLSFYFLFNVSQSFANSDLTIATIRILDKITAQSVIKDIEIGQDFEYGDITIKIHKCWNAPLEQKPETKMLVQVFDKNQQQQIFFGWLFASSPSISSIEHPIYDLNSIICK